jgi:hypothetical protein
VRRPCPSRTTAHSSTSGSAAGTPASHVAWHVAAPGGTPRGTWHAARNMQRTACNMQRTTSSLQHATGNAQRTTHNVQRTTHNAQRTTARCSTYVAARMRFSSSLVERGLSGTTSRSEWEWSEFGDTSMMLSSSWSEASGFDNLASATCLNQCTRATPSAYAAAFPVTPASSFGANLPCAQPHHTAQTWPCR